MPVQSYLFFEGRCEEALDFYRGALGAEVNALMRYKESPDKPPPGMPPIPGDKVMHVSFRIGDTELMASDGMASGTPEFKGFSLCITARDEGDARQKFDALAKDGQVQMPLGKTFFSPCFGMVQDRFGVSWMLIVMK